MRQPGNGSHGRDRNGHGQVLPREVNNRIGVRCHSARDSKLQRHVLRSWRRDDSQGTESRQVYGREWLWAGSWYDEHLDRGECEAGRSTGQEGSGRGGLLLRIAIEADLFTFLSEHRAEDGNEGALVTAVGGKGGLGFGERAQDYVGEGLGKDYGFDEGCDWEHVFARLDCGLAGGFENAVHTCGMQFLLLECGSAMITRECRERLTLTTAVNVSITYVLSNGAMEAASYPGTLLVTFASSSVKYATSNISFRARSCRVVIPVLFKILGRGPFGGEP